MRGIRLGAASIVISLAASMSGCWMMAASLAPLGLQVVEATAIRTGEGISGKTPTDEFEGGVDCESLGRGLPYVAEVRTRPDGGVDMRQFGLCTTTGSTRWQVVNDATGADPQGWRPELAIGQLTFDPPLTEAIKSSQGKYLVSAPTEPTSE